MNPFAIGAFTTGISAAFFGIFVFLKNKKRVENQTFGLMSASLTVWAVNFGLWQMATDKVAAFTYVRLLMTGAISIPIFYIHYILSLLNLVQEKKRFLITAYLISFIFLISNFTPFMTRNLRTVLYFSYWPEGGLAFHSWFAWFFGILSYGIYLLIISLKRFTGHKREQTKYTLLATLVSFGGGLTIFPLWYKIPIPPIGIYIIWLYPLILSYAIVRYRFMDIRLTLGRGAVYILSFATVISFAFSMMFLNSKLAYPFSYNILGIIVIVSGIFLFQFFFQFYEKLAAKYFYYTFYNYQTVITQLGKELTRFLDLDQLTLVITTTLLDTMKLDRTVVLLRDAQTGRYQIKKNIGFKEENGISLVKDNFLTIYLEKTQEPLVCEELSLIIRDTKNEDERNKLETLRLNMKKIEAAVCLPLLIERKIVGMIVLGNKIAGEPYSEEDVELLTTLANQASIALQNATLYSQVTDLSENLQERVDEQTKELRKAYEELKQLDEAKSEFISMASHQLRTPLSIIKGYVSMILEGTYDKLPNTAEEKLKHVFASNERLIDIVNDLLDISKIELGKMELDKKKVRIEEIIKTVYQEMILDAQKKNLSFVWTKPKTPLPMIEIDELKIRQALLNIVDNSIKYTKEGKIEIKAKKTDSAIQVSVSDTGEGLSLEEQKEVFEGFFSRGAAGINLFVHGTGLGLYIAKKYLFLHGGKIWAESKGKGKGSTFYIEIPIKNNG